MPGTASAASLLNLLSQGSKSSLEIQRALHLTQPTVSRRLAEIEPQIVREGQGRKTRYHARRRIPGLPDEVVVYDVSPPGPTRLATLMPVAPDGLLVSSAHPDLPGYTRSIPWFLYDLQPSGFLGRLVPRRHPELGAPTDLRTWTADHTLRYLTTFGGDLQGSLIVGDAAYQHHLQSTLAPPPGMRPEERAERYPVEAEQVLSAGPAGSSAGGEQPKFLTTLDVGKGRRPVLVKFSPPRRQANAIRVADLLVAEHLALQILRERGVPAAESAILSAGERVFLEVSRFDRTPDGGRRGSLSLLALDLQFVGSDWLSWEEPSRELLRQGRIGPTEHAQVQWLRCFGDLIANTDMHGGNLSFTFEHGRLGGLTPVYDMLPMGYMPRNNELPEAPRRLPLPVPSQAAVWPTARDAAEAYWRRVADHPMISAAFQALARGHVQELQAMAAHGHLLPPP